MPGRATNSPPRHIVFSHANSFPAGTYRKLFEHWRAAGWVVSAPHKFGHDPTHPVTGNWPHLRDELLRFIEREVGEPAFLVGHSLGGYLSVMVAAQRPDLARGVVLLDSPIVSGWKARALQLGQATGLGARFTPGVVSRRRRTHWTSEQAAHEHFAAKPAFARWDPEVLRDYIAAGTEAHGTQRRLSFSREVETAIYDTLPHHIPRLLRSHPLRCPLAFIGGKQSDELRLAGMAATLRLADAGVHWVEGSHLFPMERPVETGDRVLGLLAAIAPT